MVKSAKPESKVTIDRRGKGKERREKQLPVALERREKVSRRRQIDPTTCERDYTPDEVEFMHALDRYKRSSGRMFPTCSEVLEVLRGLGYQKVAPAIETGVTPAPTASGVAEITATPTQAV